MIHCFDVTSFEQCSDDDSTRIIMRIIGIIRSKMSENQHEIFWWKFYIKKTTITLRPDMLPKSW